VVVSHNHYDHMDLETLRSLSERFAPRILVPLGDKALLESAGVKRVEELGGRKSIDARDAGNLHPGAALLLARAF
jgi:L-ascorbate metabolism protein UlaG (beta-lactamase superfamily)